MLGIIWCCDKQQDQLKRQREKADGMEEKRSEGINRKKDEIRELRTYLSKEFNLKKRRPNALCIKNFPEQRTV